MSFNPEDIIKKAKAEGEVLLKRAKDTKPVDWAIMALVAFVYCFMLKSIAWRSKDSGTFSQTLALLFYAAVITLVCALTRPVLSFYNQFSTAVVVFSALRAVSLINHSALFIGASVPLVNFVASKASQAASKASTK